MDEGIYWSGRLELAARSGGGSAAEQPSCYHHGRTPQQNCNTRPTRPTPRPPCNPPHLRHLKPHWCTRPTFGRAWQSESFMQQVYRLLWRTPKIVRINALGTVCVNGGVPYKVMDGINCVGLQSAPALATCFRRDASPPRMPPRPANEDIAVKRLVRRASRRYGT